MPGRSFYFAGAIAGLALLLEVILLVALLFVRPSDTGWWMLGVTTAVLAVSGAWFARQLRRAKLEGSDAVDE